MKIDYPQLAHIPGLRRLWQSAFGDGDAFLDCFFATAYSPLRCRCITGEGEIAAGGYWLDCEYQGHRLAYIYALATAKAHQGRGLATDLLADMEKLMTTQGYSGILLCPGNVPLFEFYRARGYGICSYIDRFEVEADGSAVSLEKIGAAEYARLRRQLLPLDGVLQEGASLAFLESYCGFYRGDGFLLCGWVDDNVLFVPELLGNCDDPAGIAVALGTKTARIRTPGDKIPFAMYRSLDGTPAPHYFGLAFD